MKTLDLSNPEDMQLNEKLEKRIHAFVTEIRRLDNITQARIDEIDRAEYVLKTDLVCEFDEYYRNKKSDNI